MCTSWRRSVSSSVSSAGLGCVGSPSAFSRLCIPCRRRLLPALAESQSRPSRQSPVAQSRKSRVDTIAVEIQTIAFRYCASPAIFSKSGPRLIFRIGAEKLPSARCKTAKRCCCQHLHFPPFPVRRVSRGMKCFVLENLHHFFVGLAHRLSSIVSAWSADSHPSKFSRQVGGLSLSSIAHRNSVVIECGSPDGPSLSIQ